MITPYEDSLHRKMIMDEASQVRKEVFEKAERLTLQTPDKEGNRCDDHLLGLRLLHTGNRKVYVIQDFAWDGATDMWHFLAKEENVNGAVFVSRPLSHIVGRRSNNQARYIILK